MYVVLPEHQAGRGRLAWEVQEIGMKVTFEPGLERQVADCWFQTIMLRGNGCH